MLSKEERAESKAKRKAELKRLKRGKKAYQPYTWIPPVTEVITLKNGKTRTLVKEAGYWKLTKNEDDIVQISGRSYVVQHTGALKRLDLNESRATRRAKKNKHDHK